MRSDFSLKTKQHIDESTLLACRCSDREDIFSVGTAVERLFLL